MAAVEEINSPVLKKILAAERETFNAKFNAAKYIYPHIEAEDFFALLRRFLPRLVENLKNYEESKITEIVIIVYEKILELLGKRFFEDPAARGADERLFDELLCSFPHLLAENPELFMGAVANATINIAETPGAKTEEWLNTMLQLGKTIPNYASGGQGALFKKAGACPQPMRDLDLPVSSGVSGIPSSEVFGNPKPFFQKGFWSPKASALDLFLESGKVAAWRCGLAHYRPGALEVCKSLPFELVKIALNIQEDTAVEPGEFISRLEADPWLNPASAAAESSGRKTLLLRKAGGFSGFGGPFAAPPLVTESPAGFIVSDMETHFLFFADIFGQTLQRISAAEFDQLTEPNQKFSGGGKEGGPSSAPRAAGFLISQNGALRLKENYFPQPGLAGFSSFAGNSHSFCVTMPLSHHFYFGGLVEGEA